jgi:hypothetical protein
MSRVFKDVQLDMSNMTDHHPEDEKAFLRFICRFFRFVEEYPYHFLSTDISGKWNPISRIFEALCGRFGFFGIN